MKYFKILPIVFLMACSLKPSKTVVKFYNFESGPAALKIMEQIISEFEKENPDIKIKNMASPYRGYIDKLFSMLLGNPPDIFEIPSFYMPELIAKHGVEPLDSYMRNSGMNPADFFKAAISPFRFDGVKFGTGTVYGLPKDWSPMAIYYNKEVFEKLGVPFPSSERSMEWEEFLSLCRRLTKRNPAGGLEYLAIKPDDFHLCFSLIYENGGRFFNSDATRCVVSQDPKAREALQFFFDMVTRYKIFTLQERTEINPDFLFKTGKMAMKIDGRYFASALVKEAPDLNWGVAPFIQRHGKKVNFIWGPVGWMIAAKSKNKEAAWKFLSYLVSEKVQNIIAEYGWNIPALKSSAMKKFLNNPKHPPGVNEVFWREIPYARPYPMSKYITFFEILDKFGKFIDNVLYLKKDFDQSLKSMCSEINSVIKENMRKEAL